jgi:hypothetical protein
MFNILKTLRERRYQRNRQKLLSALERDIRENIPTAMWETPLAEYSRNRMHRLYYRVNLLMIRLLCPKNYDEAYRAAAHDGHVPKMQRFGLPSRNKHLHSNHLYTDYKPFKRNIND